MEPFEIRKRPIGAPYRISHLKIGYHRMVVRVLVLIRRVGIFIKVDRHNLSGQSQGDVRVDVVLD
jgi:hypothetical protein